MSLVLIWPHKVTEMFSALCSDPTAQQEKCLLQSDPSASHSHRETQRGFFSLIGDDVGSSQPPECMEELKCRFKSLHLILLSFEIFKQQKLSCKTNSDKREFD